MAKAKAKRAKGRRAASPRRATGPAKSRKSKKSLKARPKGAAKRQRRPARKAVPRAAGRRAAAASRTRKRTQKVAKRVRKVARPARKAATSARTLAKPAPRKLAQPAPRKTVARRPAVAKPSTRKAVAVPAPARPVGAVIPPAAAAPVVSPPKPRARKALPVHGKLPALDRERRRLPEADVVPSPPSSLNLNRAPSAARSGQAEIAEHLADHTETGPEITGGDVDASWESAYSTGDEAPGGDNPTPDQDVVDEIGRSLGLVYEDSEELKGADKIAERDKHRWELDPASAEDFEER